MDYITPFLFRQMDKKPRRDQDMFNLLLASIRPDMIFHLTGYVCIIALLKEFFTDQFLRIPVDDCHKPEALIGFF